ncbi:lyase family protein [Listeria grandensis]|uniref:lyase family protein n=1 Tax=Listeria grandensis TaxID=1494963 RepID=UPI00164E0846|nr:lyase family protein [Listeria grandensis]MBC6314350.1 aspartate ammonia-lyase [Listeria grandensis]
MSETVESRIERDYFGEVEIPQNHQYGILTARAVANLSFSGVLLSGKTSFIRAMLEVKKAASLTNVAISELSVAKGNAIATACDTLLADADWGAFVVDAYHGGGGIATNVNVNEVVAHVAGMGVDATEDVNRSQSTADACHTALHIALYRDFEKLLDDLELLEVVVVDKATLFAEIETISRTCLQDGMRFTQGERFSGYADVLKRRRKKVMDRMPALLTVNLGKTVIGSGIGASPLYQEEITHQLCEVTGLKLHLTENGFDSAQNMDDIVELADGIKLYAETLLKICQDLRFLSSGPEAGIGELVLPAHMAGSTFFPGKVNPVIPETVMQGAFSIIGKVATIHLCYRHSDTDLNVFEHMAGMQLLECVAQLRAMVVLLAERCLQGLMVNKERCASYSKALIPTVVDLKEHFTYKEVQALLSEKTRSELIEILKGVSTNDSRI